MKNIIKKIFYFSFIVLFIFIISFVIWVVKFSPEVKNREKFIHNFDVKLKGKIVNIELNEYGQTLVCLQVIETNHKNYFPIYDPDEGNDTKTWEKRFFVKVQDSLAVFICENKSTSSIHKDLKVNSFVVINRNNSKSFEVFENSKTDVETDTGLNIITYPIRNNISNSCCLN